jgi:hypothetical protein
MKFCIRCGFVIGDEVEVGVDLGDGPICAPCARDLGMDPGEWHDEPVYVVVPEDDYDDWLQSPTRCPYCGELIDSATGHHWSCSAWEPGDPFIG